MKKLLKILKWTAIVIFAAFILLVIARIPFVYQKGKTEEQVAKIHATKLMMDDVMGANLPPAPGEEAGKTVAGIDANNNGIRDDVELSIFKEYPNSARTRAVLLQYALALQMEVIQPMVNAETVTEVVREQDRASSCVGDSLVPRISPESSREYSDVEKIIVYTDFVESRQLNTNTRKEAHIEFYKKLESYHSLDNMCDIDNSAIAN